MKTVLTLAIAAAALTTASTAEAGYTHQTSYYTPRVHCAPVFVCTKVVCQRTECRYAYDHCGHRFAYHVNIVTYADIYSDGSRNTYTRTFRA